MESHHIGWLKNVKQNSSIANPLPLKEIAGFAKGDRKGGEKS
jgi:hypothetical protein